MIAHESDRALVWQGDCIDLMQSLPDGCIDSVVTDPPYNLAFMGKHWDNIDGSFQHWCEQWARECLRLLKPGGHLLAFGGTRTWHRLAAGIEDAGFEIRDSIAWMYGSGFPKSLNLPGGLGTALKPAFEPVVVGRKPLAGTVAANVLAHGTGALNIDATRIETSDVLTGSGSPPLQYGGSNSRPFHATAEPRGVNQNPAGRWPANVILDESQAAALDEQSGYQTDGVAVNRNRDASATKGSIGIGRQKVGSTEDVGFGGGGGASRFFYVAKASKKERPQVEGSSAHPTVKPLTLMRWLVRLVTPEGGTVLDPFAGSGTTVEACLGEGFRCMGMERETEYIPLILHRIDRALNLE